jgi:hypothetical protein
LSWELQQAKLALDDPGVARSHGPHAFHHQQQGRDHAIRTPATAEGAATILAPGESVGVGISAWGAIKHSAAVLGQPSWPSTTRRTTVGEGQPRSSPDEAAYLTSAAKLKAAMEVHAQGQSHQKPHQLGRSGVISQGPVGHGKIKNFKDLVRITQRKVAMASHPRVSVGGRGHHTLPPAQGLVLVKEVKHY